MKTKRTFSPGFIYAVLLLFSLQLHAQEAEFSKGDIFPLQAEHVHSSSIVQLPGGDLLCCWFQGSGERNANDTRIMGSRLKKGSDKWAEPFLMADTPGHPDCNPVLFMGNDKRLHLFWIAVLANQWENSVLKWRVSDNYKKGQPKWNWQDAILLKPGEEFPLAVKEAFKKNSRNDLTWSRYAPKYEDMTIEASGDPRKRETGWMPRTHPVQLESGRILLPLYSDGFNFSLVAISDDNAKSWIPSLPIVGRGNIQPSIVKKKDGSLVALMRDNGDEPGKIMISTSRDNGYSWDPVGFTDLPNPGTSVEAIVLKNGDWLLAYNDIERDRYSLAVSLSKDQGHTWKYTKHLELDKSKKGRFAYPSVIQDSKGIVHITYSYHPNNSHKSIRHICFEPKWMEE